MRTPWRLAWILLSSLLVAPLVAAQSDLCQRSDTLDECARRVWQEVAEENDLNPSVFVGELLGEDPDDTEEAEAGLEQAQESESANVLDRLVEKNTGIAGGNGRAGVADFLQLLGITGDTGGLGGDDGEGMTIELNHFLRLPVDDGYKIGLTLAEASLFEPLRQALPEDGGSDRTDALERRLNDLDDLQLNFAYSPSTRRFGRRPQVHQPAFAALFEAIGARLEARTAAYAEANRELRGAALAEVLALFEQLADDEDPEIRAAAEEVFAGIENNDLSFDQLDRTSELLDGLSEQAGSEQPDSGEERARQFNNWTEQITDLTDELLDSHVEVERLWAERKVAFDRELTESRFFSFADLVDAQPQLIASATLLERDDLVGPGEKGLSFSYEHGFVNVNRLRRADAACQSDGGDALECFEKFLTPERASQLRRGDRFKVTLEYSDIDDYSVVLPEDSFEFLLAGGSTLTAALSYGRYLAFSPEGEGRSRVDFGWAYEDVDDSMVRQSRSVWELTYAQRVSGGLIFSAGLVYANRPEFLGEVDEEVSARFGLNYKMFRKGDL